MSDNYKNFAAILAELKAEIDRLEKRGDRIGSLNDLYERLRQRAADITAVEQHVDSVRNEVIKPVKAELAVGRRVSYTLAAIGLALTVFSVLYPFVRVDPNLPLLQSIEETQKAQAQDFTRQTESLRSLQTITSEVRSRVRSEPFSTAERQPLTGQIVIQSERKSLFDGEGANVSLRLDDVLVKPPRADADEPLLIASFDVYVNNRRLGQPEIDERFRIETQRTFEGVTYMPPDRLSVFEQDVIVVDELHRFVVADILSTQVLGRRSADDSTAAYLLASPP